MTTSQELLAQRETASPSKDHVERSQEAKLVEGLFSDLKNDRRRLRRVVNAILAELERSR